jgi:hypothetical protein
MGLAGNGSSERIVSNTQRGKDLMKRKVNALE